MNKPGLVFAQRRGTSFMVTALQLFPVFLGSDMIVMWWQTFSGRLIPFRMNHPHHLLRDYNVHGRTSVLLPTTPSWKMHEVGHGLKAQDNSPIEGRLYVFSIKAQVLSYTHPLGQWIPILAPHWNHPGSFNQYRCLDTTSRDSSLISLECSSKPPLLFLAVPASFHEAEPSA